MKYYGRLSVIALLAIAPLYGFAQEKVVPIKYGDMDQWIIRKVHESGVIGGLTRSPFIIGILFLLSLGIGLMGMVSVALGSCVSMGQMPCSQ